MKKLLLAVLAATTLAGTTSAGELVTRNVGSFDVFYRGYDLDGNLSKETSTSFLHSKNTSSNNRLIWDSDEYSRVEIAIRCLGYPWVSFDVPKHKSLEINPSGDCVGGGSYK